MVVLKEMKSCKRNFEGLRVTSHDSVGHITLQASDQFKKILAAKGNQSSRPEYIRPNSSPHGI